MAEKILGAEAGEIVEREVDYVMVNDITGVPAFEVFSELGMEPKREKIVVIPDHYVPNKDIASAEMERKLREYVRKYGIPNYFEVGRGGICHQVMIEEGFVAPGMLIVGADSHTCSYGALGAFATGIGSTEAAAVFATGKMWFKVPETQKFLIEGKFGKYVMGKDLILRILGDIGVDGSLYMSQEFHGDAIGKMSLSDRISVANMAVECGAKTGIFPPDGAVMKYVRGRARKKFSAVYPDEDASYAKEFFYDASEIVPMVARPHSPANVSPASEVDVEIDQAFLGSCTNGRIEDLRIAAKILKGRKVHGNVRMIIVPASQKVFRQAVREGLIEIFHEAGAWVGGATCAACLGGHLGVLADGEVCISSTNRNFIGRMGHKGSRVYLASPATVAASAVAGKIVDPREL